MSSLIAAASDSSLILINESHVSNLYNWSLNQSESDKEGFETFCLRDKKEFTFILKEQINQISAKRESHVVILVSDFVNFAAHLTAAIDVSKVTVVDATVHLEVITAVQSEVEQWDHSWSSSKKK